MNQSVDNKRNERIRRIRETTMIGTDLADIVVNGAPTIGSEGDPILVV